MIKTAFETQTIGKLLRDKREEKGLSYEQVSEIIKINPEYLKALENSNYDIFPSEVYIKGFLKNYSRFLGINPNNAIALYRREREKVVEQKTYSRDSSDSNGLIRNFTLTPAKIAGIAIVSIVIIILVYLGSNVSNIFAPPTLTLEEPISLSAGETGSYQTSKSELNLIGSAEIGSNLTINGQEYKTNSFEQYNVNLDLGSFSSTQINITATNEFGRESSINLNVNFIEPSPTPTPLVIETDPDSEKNINATLEIANDGAYVEVSTDGVLIISDAYDNASIINVKANDEIEIFAPIPENIILFINEDLVELTKTRSKFKFSEGQIVEVNL